MLGRPFDQTDVHLAFDDRGFDLAGVADHHIEPHARIGGMEGREPARQPVGRDRLAGCDGDRAGGAAGEILEHRTRHRSAVEHGACLAQEYPAGLGQLDAATDAVEQLDLIAGLPMWQWPPMQPTGSCRAPRPHA